MATKSLMACPYIFSSARPHHLFVRFLHQNNPFVVVSQATSCFALNERCSSSSFSTFTSSSFSTKVGLSYGHKVNTISSSFDFVGSSRNSKFSTRATPVNEAGSFDAPLMQQMENKIKEHLSAQSVTVKDVSGDGRHVCIDVVAEAFEGQSAMNRQRMVYKAIWEELQSIVHAVDQMTTKTPAEAAAEN